jgi:hypothetical protein
MVRVAASELHSHLIRTQSARKIRLSHEAHDGVSHEGQEDPQGSAFVAIVSFVAITIVFFVSFVAITFASFVAGLFPGSPLAPSARCAWHARICSSVRSAPGIAAGDSSQHGHDYRIIAPASELSVSTS